MLIQMMILLFFFLIGRSQSFELKHVESSLVAGNFLDVEMNDSLIFFATQRGIEIYRFDVTKPQIISKFSTDGSAHGVDVSNNLVYVADGYNGVCIVDVSFPPSPKLIANYNTRGQTQDIVVSNDCAYIADGSNGFLILDVSNPASPLQLGRCFDIGFAFSITLSDTMVYVGVFGGSLKVITVADPLNPSIVAEFPYGTFDVIIEDTLAYVTCNLFRDSCIINFSIINVKEPTTPCYIEGLRIPTTNKGIDKCGKYVYVNAQENGIYIIDVTIPTQPSVVASCDFSDFFGYGLAHYGNYLITLQSLQGFAIIDLSNLQMPIPSYQHNNIYWQYFAYEDNLDHLYVIGQTAAGNSFFNNSVLRIVDANTPENLEVLGELSFTGRGALYENSIDYPYLVLTIRSGHPVVESLYTVVIDVTDPSAPVQVSTIEAGGITESHFPYLFSLDGAKIRIANYRNPYCWVDSIILSTECFDIAVNGTIAYMTTQDSLVVYDLKSRKYLSSYYHGRRYAINISLDYPYLAIPYTPFGGGSFGFFIMDISDAYSPSLIIDTLICAYSMNPQIINIMGCELQDTLLYFGRGEYGFDIWKIKYHDSIYRLLTQETPNCATHCYPSGNVNIHGTDDAIYLLDRGSLEIYKLLRNGYSY